MKFVAELTRIRGATMAETPAGGAADRSGRHAAFRGGRTTTAPAASFWQRDWGAERADRVPPRRAPPAREAPARARGPLLPEWRRRWGSGPGRRPARSPRRIGARSPARTAHRPGAAVRECATAPAGTLRKPGGRPATRRG